MTSAMGKLRISVCPGLRHSQQKLDSDPYCWASALMTLGKLLNFFLPQVLSLEGQLKGVIEIDSQLR